jgi:cytochrome c-type biogenesis protein
MVDAPLGLALAAGVLAAVNPCGFALLPAYLALLVRGEAGATDPGRGAAVGRALLAAAAMTLGFAAVFGVFGLAVAPVAASVQEHLPWFTIVLGVAVAVLGVWLLAGRELPMPSVRFGVGPQVRRTWPSMVLFGAAYAIASLGCTIAPFMAIVVTSFRAGSIPSGIALFLAYAAGMGLAVGAAALAVALAHGAPLGRVRRLGPLFIRGGGALLAVAGAYVAYYGWYEVRVIRGAAGADPVIDAAAAVQGALASALDRVGGAGLAVVVAALLAAALVTHLVRRRLTEPRTDRTQPR